jgi:uncharacterized protein (DUF697 family)
MRMRSNAMPLASRPLLMRKRWKTLALIVPAAAITGTASGAPTPGFEIPKQMAAVSTADIKLMAQIYKVYFGEDITTANMTELLTEAGLLVAVGGSMVYSGVKFSEAAIAEVLNFVPGAGWIASGLITASVTATVATLWWWYCDRQTRYGRTRLTGPRPAFA